MKNLILLLLTILLPAMLIAQEVRVPDNDVILAEALNAASPHYYPALMSRFMDDGQGLTDEDYHYLYYGFAYCDDYKPLDPVPGANEMLSILEKTPVPDSTGCRHIIEWGREVMKRDPFSPTTLNIMAYAYTLLGDTVSAVSFNERCQGVIRTIKNSGSGLKESSPWAIISFSHAEDVLVSMGLSTKTRRVISRTTEFIQTGGKDDKIKGYYFDFTRIYWNKPDNLPQKRSQGFEINGIKVK